MLSLVLIVSGLLVIGALGVLIRSVMALRREIGKSALAGSESVSRIRGAVAGIGEEERLLRHNLALLSGAAAGWPRATLLPHEAGLLARHIRSLGVATAFVASLRRSPWKVIQQLVSGG